jgi:hypothetical protein
MCDSSSNHHGTTSHLDTVDLKRSLHLAAAAGLPDAVKELLALREGKVAATLLLHSPHKDSSKKGSWRGIYR